MVAHRKVEQPFASTTGPYGQTADVLLLSGPGCRLGHVVGSESRPKTIAGASADINITAKL